MSTDLAHFQTPARSCGHFNEMRKKAEGIIQTYQAEGRYTDISMKRNCQSTSLKKRDTEEDKDRTNERKVPRNQNQTKEVTVTRVAL